LGNYFLSAKTNENKGTLKGSMPLVNAVPYPKTGNQQQHAQQHANAAPCIIAEDGEQNVVLLEKLNVMTGR
jgi:hypothetical protein